MSAVVAALVIAALAAAAIAIARSATRSPAPPPFERLARGSEPDAPSVAALARIERLLRDPGAVGAREQLAAIAGGEAALARVLDRLKSDDR
jgi:hypothetical protein